MKLPRKTPLVMVHPDLPGRTAVTYQGFSWSTFLFGPLPALKRADAIGVVYGLAVALLSLILWWKLLAGFITWTLWAWRYNYNHRSRLEAEGWHDLGAYPDQASDYLDSSVISTVTVGPLLAPPE